MKPPSRRIGCWLAAAALAAGPPALVCCAGIGVLLWTRSGEARMIRVSVDCPASSAEEVEQQFAVPLEQALGGLPAVIAIDSFSTAGRCTIDLQFDAGSDWFAN